MTLTPPKTAILPECPGPLIDGKTVGDTTGGTYRHRYAADGTPTRDVPLAGPADIDLAVQSARAAFPAWRRLGPDERRRILYRAASLIEQHADELVDLNVLDNGSPLSMVARNPSICADWFAYNAGWADKIGGEVVETWDSPALDYTVVEPYGVVAILLPWNGPVRAIGMSVATALAAGNCVVLKPSELAPFSALRVGELLLEAGLPPGVLNVVPSGPEGGAALCGHPGVDKVHFTGGADTARKVLAEASTHLTPVTLELGGKSANIIFPDADLDAAARFATVGATAMSGQGCINPTRIFVHSQVYDSVLQRTTALLRGQRQGDPLDPRTVLGPVVTEGAARRILGFVERATQEGASLVTGGTRLGGDLADGFFVAPTILSDVDPQAEIAQREVFGPVLCFFPFDTEEEAVELANATEYGLAAYVTTDNLARAHRVARQLEAGTVMVNEMAAPSPAAPFGGVKRSGYGRVGGSAGIREFTRPRNVRVALGPNQC